MELVTGFILVGCSGYTVDNREVREKDILDIAELYDPESEYQARINYEHSWWSEGWGKVKAVKSEKLKDGRYGLYAKLKVGAQLLKYASANDGTYFSMEITRDYKRTGKTYMYGLAATVDPACCGLEELKFSARKSNSENEKTVFLKSELVLDPETEEKLKTEPLKIPAEIPKNEPKNKDTESEDRFVNKVSKALLALFKTDSKNTDEEPMTPEGKEKFQTLEDKVAKLTTQLSKEEPEAKSEPEAKIEPEAKSELGQILSKLEDFTKNSVTKEDFKGLSDRIQVLEKKSNTLLGVDLTEFENGSNSHPGY